VLLTRSEIADRIACANIVCAWSGDNALSAATGAGVAGDGEPHRMETAATAIAATAVKERRMVDLAFLSVSRSVPGSLVEEGDVRERREAQRVAEAARVVKSTVSARPSRLFHAGYIPEILPITSRPIVVW
jgi:hypothetical protein